MMLAISTNSFHYKYYRILRKMWSFQEREERTSLCLYTQFLFWMTFLTVLVSPLILGGWLILKLGRSFYKICSWTTFGRRMLDWLDDWFGWGDKIDEFSKEMRVSPAATLTKVCLVVLGIGITISAVVGILIYGIICIKFVLFIIMAFFASIALAFFYLSYFIGLGLSLIYGAICWVLKTAFLFLAMHSLMIVWIIGGFVIAGLLSAVMIKLAASSEKVMQFFGFKINGYHQAREENEKRRKELEIEHKKLMDKLKKEREDLRFKKMRGEIPYSLTEKIIIGIGSCFKSLFRWIYSKSVNVGGGTYRMIGSGGVIWETLRGIKNGVCPLVEFIDENDTENDPK